MQPAYVSLNLTFPRPADVTEEVTDHAIKSGYRHVDSATMYRNEQPAAAGMLKSGVPREQLYFTSKVPPREVNYEGAKKAVRIPMGERLSGF